jgi:anthranilate synthase component 1
MRPDKDAFDLIRATFPAGTLSGAPKIRAMEIISELEPAPRGPYGGAVGYIGYDGTMDLAITIRTAEVIGDEVKIQAGAGIVYDSVPEKEWEETESKARGLVRALELAAQGLHLEPTPS